ncbi:MAG: exodeoxyribonuclease V subunit gamma [Candidatus Obscuribacterales bacterium]|nr:exodeoxyribonuclease V subunit gamma [Candidatus Obscuribacterales bacterium]
MSDCSIKLTIGPYRSGKTRHLLRKAIELKQNDVLARCVFIVPSARYKKLLHELLTEEAAQISAQDKSFRGIFGLEIHPFYHACRLVLQARGQNLKVMPDELRPTLLQQTLLKLRDQGRLKTLAPLADFQGSGTAILDLIDEFQRAGLSPEDLLERLNLSNATDSRDFELATIYQAYWQEISELKHYDSKRIAFMAREELYADKPADLGISYLFIDGFDRVSHLQAQIFAGIAKQTEQTEVAFDYAETQAEPQQPFTLAPSDYAWKQSSLNELLNNLSGLRETLPAKKKTELNQTSFTVTLDKFSEMSEIARRCKNAILNQGVAPREILVVVRSLDSYAGAIELAFEDAGLEYFIDGSIEVKTLPVWRFIRKLLTLSAEEFRRNDLVEVLRSPYLNLEALGLTHKETSILEHESYKSRLVSGRQSWTKFFNTKKNLKDQLEKFFDTITPKTNISTTLDFVHWVENCLETYLSELPLSSTERPRERQAEQEALSAVRRALKSLVLQSQLFASEKESYTQFIARFIHLVESSNYARIPQSNQYILISSADLAPNRLFKAVHIAGMNEGDYPRRHHANGFTSPDELKHWQNLGIDLYNPRNEASFERALFYSLTERATANLNFSRPEMDMNGEEYVESFYLTELDELNTLTPEKLPPFFSAAYLPYSNREALISKLWHDTPLDSIATIPALAEYGEQFNSCFAAASSRTATQEKNLFSGNLRDFVIASALKLSLPDSWTATKLNDFGQCPFRFWASHILDLEPREEIKPGLTTALLGRTYHKALELFFQKLVKINKEERGAKVPELIAQAFKEAIAWLEALPDFQPSKYWASEQNELLFRLTRFINKELERLANDPNGFFPTLFEVSFGREDENSFPPLVINDNDQQVKIRGSIDRLDLGTNGKARVVDYKTGSSAISVREAEEGRNIQLPVYALAVQKSISPQSTVSSGQYLSVNAGKPIGQLDFQSEKLNQLLEQTEELVRNYVRQIKSGDFSITPSNKYVCKKCHHRRVCRIAEISGAAAGDDSDA